MTSGYPDALNTDLAGDETSAPTKPVDWARVSDKQIHDADPRLMERLRIWVEAHTSQGHVVRIRYSRRSHQTVYEAFER